MEAQTPTGGSDAAPANDSVLSVREAADNLVARREAAPPTQGAPDTEQSQAARARDANGRFARAGEPEEESALEAEVAAASDDQEHPGADPTADDAAHEPPIAP